MEVKQQLGALVPGWYEPSWGVNCGQNLIRLIAKGYAQIVSDLSVDVSDVSEVLLTGLS